MMKSDKGFYFVCLTINEINSWMVVYLLIWNREVSSEMDRKLILDPIRGWKVLVHRLIYMSCPCDLPEHEICFQVHTCVDLYLKLDKKEGDHCRMNDDDFTYRLFKQLPCYSGLPALEPFIF